MIQTHGDLLGPDLDLLDEHVGLAGRLLDAAASDVEIFWLNLDADETTAHLDAGDACRSAAHEGIDDDLPDDR